VAGGSTAGFRFRWEEQFPFVGGKGCIRGVPSKLAWCILGAYIRLFIRFGGYWKFGLDTPPPPQGTEVSQAFIITEGAGKVGGNIVKAPS
jgi:hypothetical protein